MGLVNNIGYSHNLENKNMETKGPSIFGIGNPLLDVSLG